MGCSEVILTTHLFHEHMFPISFRLGTVLVLGEGKHSPCPGYRSTKLGVEGTSGGWPRGSREGLLELVGTELSLKL